MKDEEILKCLDNIKKNAIKRKEERLSSSNSFRVYKELESNIKSFTEKINYLSSAFEEHKIVKDKKTFNVNAFEVLTRENIEELTGLKNVFGNVSEKFNNSPNKTEAKKLSGFCSNIIVAMNNTISKNNMKFQSISHVKNQYRIVKDIPKEAL